MNLHWAYFGIYRKVNWKKFDNRCIEQAWETAPDDVSVTIEGLDIVRRDCAVLSSKHEELAAVE